MRVADTLLGRNPARIGPGRLFLVVGPSGVGKDTLIAGAAHALSGDPRYVFPRRVVTRPSNDFEGHDSVDEAGFKSAAASGAFAFSWQAHGLSYGIPIAVDDDIRSGRKVICNVSRTVIRPLYTRYEHMTVILVTAPHEVIWARLLGRERASDSDLQSRMSRTQDINALFRPDFIIRNDGSVELGVQALLRLVSAPDTPPNFAAEMLF
jgi:ribose 1,5-bisphosphokinase